MNEVNVPEVKKPVDPVERSISKPDAFTKPASFTNKPAAKGPQRVRTMDWKKGKGRPRKKAFDYRAVKFFLF